MKFATVEGITLHYALDGLNTGVPLVFINSLGCDLRLWAKLIPHFTEHFPIICYDKRGHGLSDCPPGPYSVRDHSGGLAGLLKYLEVEEAILVGISVGGVIALDYAINNPQRVKALVLCDTAAKIGTVEFWNERIAAIQKSGLADMAGTILGRWFSPAFSDQYPADYQGYYNMLSRTPLEGYIATCKTLRDADLREFVKNIKAKTLVLCGAEDLATPPNVVRELAEFLPDAHYEQIEQAAHLPCVEQPDSLAKKIKLFLQGNGYV